jgi:tetratricopeptide (TPR) repeat protein
VNDPAQTGLQTGMDLAAKYRWAEALPHLRAAAKAGVGSRDLFYRLAQACRATGFSPEAVVALDRALAIAPTDRDALFLRAVCLREGGNHDDAAVAYQRLLAHHPEDFTGWSLYGVLLRGLRRHDEAATALRRALALREDIPTRNALVIALVLAGRETEAREEGLRCLRIKDETARERFGASPFAAQRPTPREVSFDHRKPSRNVIAFSLWGDNPVYVHGAIVNARIAPHLYTGWSTRFYVDDSVPADALNLLRAAGAQVIVIDDPALARIRPMWRFLVSDDPQVDFFLCRDADSRLNVQEFLAVQDWLASGRSFHVMRDHLYHMELMLAGMWGGKAGVLPPLRDWILKAAAHFDSRFGDQAFLMEQVWPLIRDDLMTHDSAYQFHNARPFPGYSLPRPIHVGGGVKQMPHWRGGA